MSSTAVTGMPASAIALAVPPTTRAARRLVQPAGEFDDAGLVVHREQRSRDLGSTHSTQLPEHFGIEPAFDFLDPLVQGLDGVVGEDGHRLLRQDRTFVDLEPGEVHGAPVTFTPRGQCVVDRVPALERRQQRGVGVDDAIGEGVVDRLREDGAEAGHRDEVDLVTAEGVEHLVGVRARGRSRHRRWCARPARSRTPAASAMPSAPHGRSARTTTMGRSWSSMARRMVPLPDASTAIRATV